MASYSEVATFLGALLREFGPSRKAVHSSFPFWRLCADSVWELDGATRVTVTKSGDAHESALREYNVHGGFPKAIYDALQHDSGLAEQIARSLLDAHFPPTRHRAILRAVGIDLDFVESRRRRRDSGFRTRVLQAYVYKCAVCSFAVRLNDRPVAIDAAHIRWHRAHGPATVSNGIALCALHHELFDAGTFTLAREASIATYSRPLRSTSLVQQIAEERPATDSIPRPIVVVAPLATGEGLDEALGRYKPASVRGARRIAWPCCFPPGAPDGAGGVGDTRGVRVAGRRV